MIGLGHIWYSNIMILHYILSQVYAQNQYLGLTDFSKRISLTFHFCIERRGRWRQMHPHLKNGAVLKKLPRPFLFFGWDTALIDMRLLFSPENWLFNTETQTQVRFFENISSGPRYRGLFSGVRGNEDQILGRNIGDKGAKNSTQKKRITITSSKFDLVYDVTIKHDLNQ